MSETNGNDAEKRVWPAIWRGVKCKCPQCGKGRLFRGYLDQVDHCAVCGEPLAYYKAGLFLSFVVITIVIHILAFAMLDIELRGGASPITYLYTLIPISILLPLAILPSCKGAIVGLLWAKGWSDEQDR
jgi:uncharacterized protein (DUF983 family)